MVSSSHRTKRTALTFAVRAVALLGLGAVSTFAIAWFAVVVAAFGRTSGHFAWEELTKADRRSTLVRLTGGAGVWDGIATHARYPDPISASGGEIGWRERMVLNWAAGLVSDPTASDMRYFTVTGWPAPALWSEFDFDRQVLIGSPRSGPYVTTSSGAVNVLRVVGHSDFARFSEVGYPCLALPFRPLWLGLGFNTALYAGLWAMLLLTSTVTQRVVRRRRGRCTACGYDLRGDYTAGCPECGWGRTPAASNG